MFDVIHIFCCHSGTPEGPQLQHESSYYVLELFDPPCSIYWTLAGNLLLHFQIHLPVCSLGWSACERINQLNWRRLTTFEDNTVEMTAVGEARYVAHLISPEQVCCESDYCTGSQSVRCSWYWSVCLSVSAALCCSWEIISVFICRNVLNGASRMSSLARLWARYGECSVTCDLNNSSFYLLCLKEGLLPAFKLVGGLNVNGWWLI